MSKPCGYSGCVFPIWSNGFCKNHQWKRQDAKYIQSRKSFASKHIEKMKAKNKDVVVEEKSELDLWFDEIIESVVKRKPYCWNCGEFIPEKYYRHAVAHIFPKNIFESVATHEMNYLILGAGCGCHHDTHRLDTFSTMPIFKEAVRRFKIFGPFILEKHKYLDEFRTHVDKFLKK